MQLIARVQQFKNTADQTRLVEKLFGGESFLRLVQLTAEGLKDALSVAGNAAPILKQEDVDRATQLSQEFHKIGGTISDWVIPQVLELAKNVNIVLDRLKSVDKLTFDGLKQQLDDVNERLAEETAHLERAKKEAAEGGWHIFSDPEASAKIAEENIKKDLERKKQIEAEIMSRQAKGWVTTVDVSGNKFEKDDKEKKKAFDTEIQKIQGRVEILKAENNVRKSFHGTEEDLQAQLDREKTVTELLNAAKKAEITLTDEQKKQIQSLADAYKVAADEARKLAKAHHEALQRADELENSSKDALKGSSRTSPAARAAQRRFITPLKKLSDKLMDMALDAVWKSIFTDSTRGNNMWSTLGDVFKPATTKTARRLSAFPASTRLPAAAGFSLRSSAAPRPRARHRASTGQPSPKSWRPTRR